MSAHFIYLLILHGCHYWWKVRLSPGLVPSPGSWLPIMLWRCCRRKLVPSPALFAPYMRPHSTPAAVLQTNQTCLILFWQTDCSLFWSKIWICSVLHKDPIGTKCSLSENIEFEILQKFSENWVDSHLSLRVDTPSAHLFTPRVSRVWLIVDPVDSGHCGQIIGDSSAVLHQCYTGNKDGELGQRLSCEDSICKSRW